MTVAITPRTSLGCAGAVIHVYHARKGEGHPYHEHEYSHAIICHAGSCSVTTPQGVQVVDSSCGFVTFEPNQPHDICALEDNTVFANIFDSSNFKG